MDMKHQTLRITGIVPLRLDFWNNVLLPTFIAAAIGAAANIVLIVVVGVAGHLLNLNRRGATGSQYQ